MQTAVAGGGDTVGVAVEFRECYAAIFPFALWLNNGNVRRWVSIPNIGMAW